MKKLNVKTLIASVIAIVICFTTLIGSTYAWFTDSATSSNNKIIAGTLKVDLELLDKQNGWKSIKNDNTPIFDCDKWEPGYTGHRADRLPLQNRPNHPQHRRQGQSEHPSG